MRYQLLYFVTIAVLLGSFQTTQADSYPMGPLKDNLCPKVSDPEHKTVKLNQAAMDKLMDKLEALDKECESAREDLFDEVHKYAEEYAKNKAAGKDDKDLKQKLLKAADEKMQNAVHDYFLKSVNQLSGDFSKEEIDVLTQDYDKLSDSGRAKRRDLQKHLFEYLGYIICDHRTQYGIQALTISPKHPKGLKVKEYFYESDPHQDSRMSQRTPTDVQGKTSNIHIENISKTDLSYYDINSDPWFICTKRMGFKVHNLDGGKYQGKNLTTHLTASDMQNPADAKTPFGKETKTRNAEGSLPDEERCPVDVVASADKMHVEMGCFVDSKNPLIRRTGTTQGRDKPGMPNYNICAQFCLPSAETLTPQECAKRDNEKLAPLAPVDLFSTLDWELDAMRSKLQTVIGEGLRTTAAAAGEMPAGIGASVNPEGSSGPGSPFY